MKRKNVISKQLMMSIIGIVSIITIICVSLASFIVKHHIENLIEGEVETTKNLINNNITTADSNNDRFEEMLDMSLLYIGENISNLLEGKTIEQVTQEELINIAKKYNLTGLSLAVKEEGNGELYATVAKSTFPAEIETVTTRRTKYTSEEEERVANQFTEAVDKLWRLQKTESEIFRNNCCNTENFFSSPIIKSIHHDTYYKYGYYYDGKTDFIIMSFVSSNQIEGLKKDGSVNNVIKNILNNKNIMEIGIVNVEASLAEKPYEFNELPVIYGTNNYKTDKDKELIKTSRNLDQKTVVTIDNYMKYFLPLEGNKVMTLVIDVSDYDKIVDSMLLTIVSISIICLIFMFLIIKNVTAKKLNPLKKIERHLRNVSSGDFSSRVIITEENELGWLADKVNEMTVEMKRLIDDINHQAEQRLNTTEETYLQEFKSLLASLASIKHDYANQLSVIQGLLVMKKSEQAKEYVYKLSHEFINLKQTLNVNNPFLSALFHSKLIYSESKNIRMIFDIEDYQYDDISSVDLIKVFSNLIDNAIDATLKMERENRMVLIQLKRSGKVFIATIENTGIKIPSEDLISIFENGYTTSKENGRGYGLGIVNEIVKKYNGEIKCISNENTTKFELFLLPQI